VLVSGKPSSSTGLTIPSQNPPQSQNRSPRMASLLLALKDVIGAEVDSPDGELSEGSRELTLASVNEIANCNKEDVEPINCTKHPVNNFLREDPALNDSGNDISPSFADVYESSCHERRGEPQNREDSIDSGYGDGITILSPARESWQNRHSSTLDLLSSPFRRSRSAQVFYPSVRGTLLSQQFSPFIRSTSEVAASSCQLSDRPNRPTRRHSYGSKASQPMRCPEDSTTPSHQKEESRSRSSSSLSSLDTLPSSPIDARVSLSTPEGTSAIRIATSPVIIDEHPAFLRSRALSDLTVVAGSFVGCADSLVEQPSELSEIEDATLTSAYGPYTSPVNAGDLSPSAPGHNFSRPSSIMSFYESVSISGLSNLELEDPVAQHTPSSPFQASFFEHNSAVSFSRSGSVCSSRRSEESSSSNLPFVFGRARRHVSCFRYINLYTSNGFQNATNPCIRSRPMSLSAQRAASAPARSLDLPPDQPSVGLRPLRLVSDDKSCLAEDRSYDL
jgi:hypothetical protein